MSKTEQIDIEQLDYSMFSDDDLLNLILQRSEILFDIEQGGRAIKAWTTGSPEQLETIVLEKGLVLAQRAAKFVQQEFEALSPVLDHISPSSIADIGCGYALFDLFVARKYDTKTTLIDLESNDRKHFGFQAEGAAYSNLGIAVKFLINNKIKSENIINMNPEKSDISALKPVDLAVSFLACGFHFPVNSYLKFFDENVKPEGHIILDLRTKSYFSQRIRLSELGKVTLLEADAKRRRVLITKRP